MPLPLIKNKKQGIPKPKLAFHDAFANHWEEGMNAHVQAAQQNWVNAHIAPQPANPNKFLVNDNFGVQAQVNIPQGAGIMAQINQANQAHLAHEQALINIMANDHANAIAHEVILPNDDFDLVEPNPNAPDDFNDLQFLDEELDAVDDEPHAFIPMEAEPWDQQAFNQKVKDVIYKTAYKKPKYKDEIVWKDEDLSYRTILTNNKRNICHIQCPKVFIGTTEELMNNVNSGVSGFNIFFNLPNDKKIKQIKENIIKDEKKQAIKIEELSIQDYYKKLDPYLTYLSGKYIGDDGYHTGLTSFKNSLNGDGQCAKLIHVAGITSNGIYVRGVTVGKYNNNNEVEIIGSQVRTGILKSYYNDPYTKNCKIQKYLVHYHNISQLYTEKIPYNFCKIKIRGFEDSSLTFGFKNLKKTLVGHCFTPDKFKVIRKFNSIKLKKEVDIVELILEDKSTIKFLLSDIDFYYIDPKTFNGQIIYQNKKSIGKLSVCKIIDDRRINLKKNDIVIVLDIKIAKDNYRNSVVTVKKKENNEIHKVFLKQLKIYNEQINSTSEKAKSLPF